MWDSVAFGSARFVNDEKGSPIGGGHSAKISKIPDSLVAVHSFGRTDRAFSELKPQRCFIRRAGSATCFLRRSQAATRETTAWVDCTFANDSLAWLFALSKRSEERCSSIEILFIDCNRAIEP